MTLNQFNLRLPASSNLSAGAHTEERVGAEVADKLLSVCGEYGELFRINGNAGDLSGFYRLRDGNRDLFLKVIPDTFLSQQIEANEFALYVKSRGLGASTICSDYPRMLGRNKVVLAYEWVDQQHPAIVDFEHLGYQVGELHKILKEYPGADLVRKKSNQRLNKLHQIAEQLEATEDNDSNCVSYAVALIKENPDLFGVFNEACQVIHGDLNVGNLLCANTGVVFLDFEDTRHSWLPVGMDISFLIERFVMINEPDDKVVLDTSKALLNGYVKTGSTKPFSQHLRLEDALGWLCARSICMLKKFEWERNPWPESEWLKFESLIKNIQDRRELMMEIEAGFIG